MPLLLLLSACKDEASPLSPYEMPDVSGCTFTEAHWYERMEAPWELSVQAWGDHELRASELYELRDQASEEIEERQAWEGTRNEDGCLLEQRLDETYGDYETTTEVVYTCDERGFPTHWEEVWRQTRGETYEEEAHTWADVRVEAEDDLAVLQVESVEADDGDRWVVRYAADWEDGLPLRQDTWEDQEWTAHEEWTYDADGHLLTYTPGHYWLFVELDEHGRPVRELYTVDAEGTEIIGVWTYEWHDEVYAWRRATWDEDGDGEGVYEYLSDCTDTWPWSCSIDVDDTDDFVPFTTEWTCE